MRKTVVLLLFMFMYSSAALQAQLYLGPKIGLNVSTMRYKKDYLNENEYTVKPIYAYQVGGILHYKANKRWSVQLEMQYSQKGREISHEGLNYVRDLLKCSYMEIPLLFRASFGGRQIRGYLNAGPRLAYWMNGKGAFSSAVLRRGISTSAYDGDRGTGGPDVLEYELDPEQSNLDSPYKIRVPKLNYVQMGLDFGMGLAIPVIDESQLFFIDVRYSLMQSFVGQNDEEALRSSQAVLRGYEQNFEGSTRALSLSLGFVFSFGELYTAY